MPSSAESRARPSRHLRLYDQQLASYETRQARSPDPQYMIDAGPRRPTCDLGLSAPHHKMAVQMAQMAKSQAQHPAVKTLAASIITSQDHEITEMTAIARKLGVMPDQMPVNGSMSAHMAGDDQTLGLSMQQTGMSMNMSTLNGAKPFDRMFIDMMIPHHQGAIRMARIELAKGSDQRLRSIAHGIIAAQASEIGRMNAWRNTWFGASSPAGGVPTA